MIAIDKYDQSCIGNTVRYIWKDKEFFLKIKEVNEPEQLVKITLPTGETWVRAENTTYIPF